MGSCVINCRCSQNEKESCVEQKGLDETDKSLLKFKEQIIALQEESQKFLILKKNSSKSKTQHFSIHSDNFPGNSQKTSIFSQSMPDNKNMEIILCDEGVKFVKGTTKPKKPKITSDNMSEEKNNTKKPNLLSIKQSSTNNISYSNIQSNNDKISDSITNINNTNLNSNNNNISTLSNLRQKLPLFQGKDYTYLGEWKNGKKDGIGIMKWEKSKLIGNFEEDKATGFGKFLSTERGYLYFGNLNDGKANGIGYYKHDSGSSYEGYFLDDKPNNFGLEFLETISYYGEFNNGVKSGFGILETDCGVYYGEFKDGFIDGIGTLEFNGEKQYEGMWKKNKMNGFGIITWKNESRFEGYFKDDKKEGFGIFFTKDKVFMGYWKDSLLNGKVIVIDGQETKKQLWENGKAIEMLDINEPIDFDVILKRFHP